MHTEGGVRLGGSVEGGGGGGVDDDYQLIHAFGKFTLRIEKFTVIIVANIIEIRQSDSHKLINQICKLSCVI